jgi:spermidine/putrescine transport system permease protein
MIRKSPLRRLYIALILALMYIPILLVILYSFNAGRLSSMWSGFTLKWYADLFRDRAMFTALRNSVILGVLASFGAAVLGTLGAAGMVRSGEAFAGGFRPSAGKNGGFVTGRATGRAAGKVMEYLSILPIMIPEIILGMVFLAFFSLLGLPFGMVTLLIAHTAICVPYVYLLVKARLAGMDKSYVEAAKNLGAGEWRAFYDITLPLVLPAVVSGMLISFAMSFDDVIISVFVTGAHTNTLPIRIYSQMKTGVTPKTNALCTLLFAITVVLCLLSAYLARPQPKAGRAAEGGADN